MSVNSVSLQNFSHAEAVKKFKVSISATIVSVSVVNA